MKVKGKPSHYLKKVTLNHRIDVCWSGNVQKLIPVFQNTEIPCHKSIDLIRFDTGAVSSVMCRDCCANLLCYKWEIILPTFSFVLHTKQNYTT